ncbi:hypothetical protein [Naumannella halotolerans]|nr:hypothetical protein [Naumannella halotolerans]
MSSVMIIDSANVVGSVPDGWWRDRAAAAYRLHRCLVDARLSTVDRVELVLEGPARQGVPESTTGSVWVRHADGLGDDEVIRRACSVVAAGEDLTVVTADRALADRIHAIGADVSPPSALLREIDY